MIVLICENSYLPEPTRDKRKTVFWKVRESTSYVLEYNVDYFF